MDYYDQGIGYPEPPSFFERIWHAVKTPLLWIAAIAAVLTGVVLFSDKARDVVDKATTKDGKPGWGTAIQDWFITAKQKAEGAVGDIKGAITGETPEQKIARKAKEEQEQKAAEKHTHEEAAQRRNHELEVARTKQEEADRALHNAKVATTGVVLTGTAAYKMAPSLVDYAKADIGLTKARAAAGKTSDLLRATADGVSDGVSSLAAPVKEKIGEAWRDAAQLRHETPATPVSKPVAKLTAESEKIAAELTKNKNLLAAAEEASEEAAKSLTKAELAAGSKPGFFSRHFGVGRKLAKAQAAAEKATAHVAELGETVGKLKSSSAATAQSLGQLIIESEATPKVIQTAFEEIKILRTSVQIAREEIAAASAAKDVAANLAAQSKLLQGEKALTEAIEKAPSVVKEVVALEENAAKIAADAASTSSKTGKVIKATNEAKAASQAAAEIAAKEIAESGTLSTKTLRLISKAERVEAVVSATTKVSQASAEVATAAKGLRGLGGFGKLFGGGATVVSGGLNAFKIGSEGRTGGAIYEGVASIGEGLAMLVSLPVMVIASGARAITSTIYAWNTGKTDVSFGFINDTISAVDGWTGGHIEKTFHKVGTSYYDSKYGVTSAEEKTERKNLRGKMVADLTRDLSADNKKLVEEETKKVMAEAAAQFRGHNQIDQKAATEIAMRRLHENHTDIAAPSITPLGSTEKNSIDRV